MLKMMTTEEETWKSIPGYEHYEVSTLGRVRKISYLKINLAKASSYLFVQLFKGDGHGGKNSGCKGETKKINVHRLVAKAFIENPHDKPQVNHLDGDKLNNHVSNLEWCTRSENVQHAYDNGLKMNLRGSMSAKRIAQKDVDGNVLRVWNGSREAAAGGYTAAKISQACGQGHKYRGCYWSYTDDFMDYERGMPFKVVDGKRVYEGY